MGSPGRPCRLLVAPGKGSACREKTYILPGRTFQEHTFWTYYSEKKYISSMGVQGATHFRLQYRKILFTRHIITRFSCTGVQLHWGLTTLRFNCIQVQLMSIIFSLCIPYFCTHWCHGESKNMISWEVPNSHFPSLPLPHAREMSSCSYLQKCTKPPRHFWEKN